MDFPFWECPKGWFRAWTFDGMLVDEAGGFFRRGGGPEPGGSGYGAADRDEAPDVPVTEMEASGIGCSIRYLDGARGGGAV